MQYYYSEKAEFESKCELGDRHRHRFVHQRVGIQYSRDSSSTCTTSAFFIMAGVFESEYHCSLVLMYFVLRNNSEYFATVCCGNEIVATVITINFTAVLLSPINSKSNLYIVVVLLAKLCNCKTKDTIYSVQLAGTLRKQIC